jgi:hypothetical protein
MGQHLRIILSVRSAAKSRLLSTYSVNTADKSLNMDNLYHTDNTAEAAFMLLKGAGLETLELNQDDGKVTIVLKQKKEGDIGEWIDQWPKSPEFKYFAVFNLLTIQIKRKLNGYRK